MGKRKKEKSHLHKIGDRFEEAAYTMKRIHVPHTHPMAYFSTWPDIVRTRWEVMAMPKEKLRLGPPSALAISRMNETYGWLFCLEIDERHLVLARAINVPWKLLERKHGKTRATLTRTLDMAYLKVYLIHLKPKQKQRVK